jgi:regulator of replication initiation timing
MKKGILGIVMSGFLALVSSHIVSYPASASGTSSWAKGLAEMEKAKNRQIDDRDRQIAEKDVQIKELISTNEALRKKMEALMEANCLLRADGYDMRTEKIENRKKSGKASTVDSPPVRNFSNESNGSSVREFIESLFTENELLKEENAMLYDEMNKKINQ